MGASVSVTSEVQSVLDKTSVNETCECKSSAVNQMGDITVRSKGCLTLPLSVSQKASAKCNCPVKAAISQLAQMASQTFSFLKVIRKRRLFHF